MFHKCPVDLLAAHIYKTSYIMYFEWNYMEALHKKSSLSGSSLVHIVPFILFTNLYKCFVGTVEPRYKEVGYNKTLL